jgi:hypothetical protein
MMPAVRNISLTRQKFVACTLALIVICNGIQGKPASSSDANVSGAQGKIDLAAHSKRSCRDFYRNSRVQEHSTK